MKVSDEGNRFIKSWETFRDKAYQPTPEDKWTVGYGSTIINGRPVKEGDTLTEARASQILWGTTNQISQDLTESIPENVLSKIAQNQFDAVVSLVYNIGMSYFRGTNTGKLFFRGADIGERFTKFDESNGQVLQGLLNRRLAEQAIYQKGEYNDHK